MKYKRIIAVDRPTETGLNWERNSPTILNGPDMIKDAARTLGLPYDSIRSRCSIVMRVNKALQSEQGRLFKTFVLISYTYKLCPRQQAEILGFLYK